MLSFRYFFTFKQCNLFPSFHIGRFSTLTNRISTSAFFDDFIQQRVHEIYGHASLSSHQELISRGNEVVKELLMQQRSQKQFEIFWESKAKNVSHQVFPTARTLNLSEMEMFGFDYDYTLAEYTEELQPLIYSMALQYMVQTMRYPSELLKSKYDPNFPIRGLYYDTKKGNVLKMDFLNNVQIDAVYFGRRPLKYSQILEDYGGPHIGTAIYPNLRPMIDRFCLAETCLIADVIEFFVQHQIPFDPSYLYNDVNKAVSHLHSSGLLHTTIMQDLPKYLNSDLNGSGVVTFLKGLRNAGKKLFLLTNSPFHFVDAGMKFLMKNDRDVTDWKKLFDIIMVSADKPNFFLLGHDRPFRELNTTTGQIKWEPVTYFKPNHVYVEGSLSVFNKITKQNGNFILYFGDHLYNDVKEPSRVSGWKTALIVSELDHEIQIQSTPEYCERLRKLNELEDLYQRLDLLSGHRHELMREIEDEIRTHRNAMKSMFNKYFGSAFKTHKTATLFAYLLQRYADVYTSHIGNFNNYPIDFTFHPERTYLPHEIAVLRARAASFSESKSTPPEPLTME